jgi:hypothetical protein
MINKIIIALHNLLLAAVNIKQEDKDDLDPFVKEPI